MEMARSKREAADDFISPVLDEGEKAIDEGAGDRALMEALYSFSEMSLFGSDVEIKDRETAMRIWALVETVKRTGGFPKELRM